MRTEDDWVVNESMDSHSVGPELVPVVCPDRQNNDILHRKLRQDNQAGHVRGDDQIDSHRG